MRKRKLFAGNGACVDLEDVIVESDYKGPHVKLPMTLQNLQELIDGFKKKKVSINLQRTTDITPYSVHKLSISKSKVV